MLEEEHCEYNKKKRMENNRDYDCADPGGFVFAGL